MKKGEPGVVRKKIGRPKDPNSKLQQKIARNQPVGRPRKLLDEKSLIKLAEIGCTMEEMAHFFDVDINTVCNNYSDTIKKGVSLRRISLRRAQTRIALSGNVAMLIWLGKQELGQKEPSLFDENDFPPPEKAEFSKLPPSES